MYISKVLKPFLVKYQTDELMIMFLAEDLHDMCRNLMHKFVKKSVFDSADAMYKIANLDILDKKNHKAAAGIAALQQRLPLQTLEKQSSE